MKFSAGYFQHICHNGFTHNIAGLVCSRLCKILAVFGNETIHEENESINLPERHSAGQERPSSLISLSLRSSGLFIKLYWLRNYRGAHAYACKLNAILTQRTHCKADAVKMISWLETFFVIIYYLFIRIILENLWLLEFYLVFVFLWNFF